MGGAFEQETLLLEEEGERCGSLERRITGEGGITARARPPEPCLWRETGYIHQTKQFKVNSVMYNRESKKIVCYSYRLTITKLLHNCQLIS